MEFNPSQQYGDFVVINADGPDDVLAPVVRDQAMEELAKQARNVVPKALYTNVTFIEHGPTWMDDHYDPGEGAWCFTVAWKYTPPKFNGQVVHLCGGASRHG